VDKQECQEVSVVQLPYTLIQPDAVVVEGRDAVVAGAAVFRPRDLNVSEVVGRQISMK
jgi:hypothetical protein